MARVKKVYRVVSHFMNGTTESSAPLCSVEECEQFMDENEQRLTTYGIHKADRPVSYTIRGLYIPTKED